MKDVTTTMQLKMEQEKDPDIQTWIKKEDPTRIIRKGGVLCRVWTPKDSPETCYEQIVLPKKYRNQVITLAHDIPRTDNQARKV